MSDPVDETADFMYPLVLTPPYDMPVLRPDQRFTPAEIAAGVMRFHREPFNTAHGLPQRAATP